MNSGAWQTLESSFEQQDYFLTQRKALICNLIPSNIRTSGMSSRWQRRETVKRSSDCSRSQIRATVLVAKDGGATLGILIGIV